jgi:ACS family hexuronate transporter-like MFS transporter
MTRYRWFILSLLFLVTTNNYLDRIVFSVLIPVIRDDLHISTQQYSYITASFQFAYTVGFLFMGKLIDRFGTRIGYAVSIAWWSAAACMHAVARTALQMGVWRGLLGLGEAGNFPSAIKAVAEWFPKKDRAFATGIFNAGTNVASMIGPPIFVWIAAKYGWRDCFLITGGVGFILVVIWWVVYRLPEHHRSVNAQELAYIKSDVEEAGGPKVGWLEALRYKETWGFALGKFLTDPVWWFYLVWLPPYLYDVRKFNLTEVGWALPVVYLMADVGSVGGGWLSGFLMRRGWPNHKARKTAMGICAGLMPIAAMSVLAPNPGAGDRAGEHRDGLAPGLVGEPVHDDLGRIPQTSRRLGNGNRGLHGRSGRSAVLGAAARLCGVALRLHADLSGHGAASSDGPACRAQAAGKDAADSGGAALKRARGERPDQAERSGAGTARAAASMSAWMFSRGMPGLTPPPTERMK